MRIKWLIGGLAIPDIGVTSAGEIHPVDLADDIAYGLINQGIAQEYIVETNSKTKNKISGGE